MHSNSLTPSPVQFELLASPTASFYKTL
uniref:Uncharacterized protein n=1 Tax=Arundo donax TaxID=35708 RepID=A0A0A8ZWS1_ARUDO